MGMFNYVFQLPDGDQKTVLQFTPGNLEDVRKNFAAHLKVPEDNLVLVDTNDATATWALHSAPSKETPPVHVKVDAEKFVKDLLTKVDKLRSHMYDMQELAQSVFLDAASVSHLANTSHWDYEEYSNMSTVASDIAHVYDQMTNSPNSVMFRLENARELLEEIDSGLFGNTAEEAKKAAPDA